MEEDSKGAGLGNVIRIERVREHLGHIVRGTVEETLNAMLEAEADPLCNAGRYERTAARRDQRSGSYRKLQTKAGAVTLKVPKLRQQTFETAIIERYRRRESSVEEALIEMYLAGVGKSCKSVQKKFMPRSLLASRNGGREARFHLRE